MKNLNSSTLQAISIIFASITIIILAAFLVYITGTMMFWAIIGLQSVALVLSIYGLIRYKGNNG